MATLVTGTLIDSLGQKWANAPIQFVFFPTPGTPGPFTVNDAEFNKMPPVILTDTNGAFSISLTSNSDVRPANSQWQMIIGPNSSYPAIVLTISLQGGTYNVSPLFAASGAVMAVQSLYVPRAYADGEVLIPPKSGQIYYDVTMKVFKYWESGNWAVLGGHSGSDMVYPPPGIAVSTGTGWAASLDPASMVYTNVVNTFTANQIFNGSIDVGSGAISIGRRGQVAGGRANINADDTNLFINSPAPGGIYLNWDQGTTGVHFGNGAGGQVGVIDQAGNAGFSGSLNVGGNATIGGIFQGAGGGVSGNWNVGSFQINGGAPNGYILMGNGTSYVPVPFPAASHGTLNVTVTDWSGQTGSRDWDGVYQNPGPGIRTVSGSGRTAGSTPGSTQGLIGTGNPGTQVWGNTVTATLQQGSAGFYFTVPPGYFYQVRRNTLSQGPGGGNGVLEMQHWLETDTTII